MNDTDSGIENETITFYPNQSDQETKTMEIKFLLSGSSLKLQLPIFKQGTAEEFLHFLARVRKNDKLTVLQFLDQLKNINMLLT